jgi:hypothetical protein
MLLRFLTPDIRMDIISPRVQMAGTNLPLTSASLRYLSTAGQILSANAVVQEIMIGIDLGELLACH